MRCVLRVHWGATLRLDCLALGRELHELTATAVCRAVMCVARQSTHLSLNSLISFTPIASPPPIVLRGVVFLFKTCSRL